MSFSILNHYQIFQLMKQVLIQVFSQSNVDQVKMTIEIVFFDHFPRKDSLNA